MNKSKSIRVLSSIALGFATLIVAPSTVQASDVLLPGLSNGATIVGSTTFSFHLPASIGPYGSYVRLQISNFDSGPGLVVAFDYTAAGDYSVTFNPFDSYSEIRSSSSHITGVNGPVRIVPGVYHIMLDFDTDQFINYQQTLDNITVLRACSPGTYSTDGGQPLDGSGCANAPLGHYASGYGNKTAPLCDAGYTALNLAQTQCDPAPVGHYSAAGTGNVAAAECAAGTFQALEGQASCDPASPGRYVATAGAEIDVDCPVGTYADVSGLDACKPARLGHFVDTIGQVFDLQCEPGKYSDATGQTACLSASPGTYVSSAGASTKTSCAKGTYQPDAGKTSCISASANFYVDTLQAITQIACPTGLVSPAGSDSVDDCVSPPPNIDPIKSPDSVASVAPTVAKGKKKSLKALAIEIGMAVPAKAKVSAKLDKASKKFCSISGSNIKGTKSGSCNVTVTVKPNKGTKSIKSTVLSVS